MKAKHITKSITCVQTETNSFFQSKIFACCDVRERRAFLCTQSARRANGASDTTFPLSTPPTAPESTRPRRSRSRLRGGTMVEEIGHPFLKQFEPTTLHHNVDEMYPPAKPTTNRSTETTQVHNATKAQPTPNGNPIRCQN